MPDIRVLDCTLRDGGYYNAWDFSASLVSAYLGAVGSARVDAIEVGFRMLPQPRFLGPFAYSTDEFLRTLPLPKGPMVGVMINAKELLEYREGPAAATNLLFHQASESPVQLVRLAVRINDLARCEPIVARLKDKGYAIGVNLMQASEASAEQLGAAARTIQRWERVDVLYIADSLGNMQPAGIQAAVAALRTGWSGPLGLHAHNNMEHALANCMAALETGVTWLDGTVLGMGRGAGNVQTERLLVALKGRAIGDYEPEALFPLVMEAFEGLQRQHGWGPNLLYYLSSTYGVHPTYVQEMLGCGRYDSHHMLDALEALKRVGASVYTDRALEQAMLVNRGSGEGSWSAAAWAQQRDVLIVARGPGMLQHREALCRFIDAKAPLVLCLNVTQEFSPERVSAYVACHQTRLLMDVGQYRTLNKPLIIPLGMVPEAVRLKLASANGFPVRDYGMRVQPDTFEARPTGCTIPAYLAAAYALALAEAGGARRALLAGFDGYGMSDPRSQEMAQVLRYYQARERAIPLMAVTPTSYEIPRGSIYAPGL
ncbi:MAG: aldolase [Candidatus Omnitrophica bacterium CG11_big_fil_rev_8_21_14_0_20_63_9]|nr:MAG: aldolase [Candidatus Omnitrophica bacterium CG11_big_fil_rev_8_21_14_0_20_63_9]